MSHSESHASEPEPGPARPAAAGGLWAGTRLHVVTGKGGVGKTTVAGALALALARGGARVLLTEVEGRSGFAELFDRDPQAYREELLAVTADGGEVYGLEVEAEAALLDYLETFYRLGRPARALRRIGAIEFATNIAPGLRDVLLLGKVYEATRRRDAGRDRFHFDAVVLDAPPTGRIARFLSVNREIAGLARVGPVHRQAESISALVRSPRTRVHLVALLEELPVQETLDAAAELTRAGFTLGAVFVNGVTVPAGGPDRAVAPGETDPARIAAALARALPAAPGDAGQADRLGQALLREARPLEARRRARAALRARLAELGLPMVDVPDERDPGLDPVELLDELADALARAGVESGTASGPAPDTGSGGGR